MNNEIKNDLTRTFICIDFPDEVIKEVARIQELMENKPFMGKFTELENLHLTLKFLGEISQKEMEEVREKLKNIKFESFNAKLGEIGIFHEGKYRAPKIIWIKLNGEKIWALQKLINEKLEIIFPKEERFTSHITIARVNYVKDKLDYEEYIKKINVKEINFKIDCFKLKSSELRMNGPVYREIEVFKLI